MSDTSLYYCFVVAALVTFPLLAIHRQLRKVVELLEKILHAKLIELKERMDEGDTK